MHGRRSHACFDLLADGDRFVDRDRIALSRCRSRDEACRRRGIHADHLTGPIDERPARVAGPDGCVRLDESRQSLHVAAAGVARGDRLIECGDRPAGHARGASDAAGVADGRHLRPGSHLRGIAQRHCLQTGGALQLQDGDVASAVIPHHGRAVGTAVADVGHADAGRTLDDMVVGQDDTRLRKHHPRSGASRPGVSERDVDVDQAGIHSRGDGGGRGVRSGSGRLRDSPKPASPR